MEINAAVGFAGDGAADNVADAEHLVPAALRLAQPGEGVERLARLRDHQQERVLVKGRIPVTELAGVFHFGWHMRQFLQQVFARPTRRANWCRKRR